jgi:hypothetical protein
LFNQLNRNLRTTSGPAGAKLFLKERQRALFLFKLTIKPYFLGIQIGTKINVKIESSNKAIIGSEGSRDIAGAVVDAPD